MVDVQIGERNLSTAISLREGRRAYQSRRVVHEASSRPLWAISAGFVRSTIVRYRIVGKREVEIPPGRVVVQLPLARDTPKIWLPVPF